MDLMDENIEKIDVGMKKIDGKIDENAQKRRRVLCLHF